MVGIQYYLLKYERLDVNRSGWMKSELGSVDQELNLLNFMLIADR